MSGLVFLDTNVFAYTFDVRVAAKRQRAEAILSAAFESGRVVISYQVVQECLNFLLRKLAKPMTQLEAQDYLEHVLMPLCKVYPSGALYSDAISIGSETGWSFYDSLIVASAASAGCDTLLTEDLQHGRAVRGVRIQNPFV
jgi:predicted nucleic acid-binding protein